MGAAKKTPARKPMHVCHMCGKAGHHATACPQLAQNVLKVLTKQRRAEDLSEHLQQGKNLLCTGVKTGPRRSLKRASGRRASSPHAWKGATASDKMKKRARKPASKKSLALGAKELFHAKQVLRKGRGPSVQSSETARMVVPAHAMSVWRCMVSGFLQRVSAPWSRPSSWRCRDCRHFSDAMDHSLLPRVRMPFSHVDAAVSLYFTGSQGPSLRKMAAHGGRSKSSLQKMRSALLGAGALCAEKIQRKRRLTGLLEADATSLRKMRLGKTRTLRYFQAFGAVKREKRVVQLYNFGRTRRTKVISCLISRFKFH